MVSRSHPLSGSRVGWPRRFLVAMLLALLALGPAVPALSQPVEEIVSTEPLVAREITFIIPSMDAVQDVLKLGIPVEQAVQETEEGLLTLTLVVHAEEQRLLEEMGFVVLDVDPGAYWQEEPEEPVGEFGAFGVLMAETDVVKVLRADCFENYGGIFLSVEARTSAGGSAAVTLRVYSEDTGEQIGGTMSRFVDAGQYMYHRLMARVAVRPSAVRVVSSQGGWHTRPVTRWPSVEGQFPFPPDYLMGFVSRYLDPTEVQEMLVDLAARFPEISEIVDLPYPTNGYRRRAMGVTGGTGTRAIVWYSRAWGHEGGNDLQVHLVNPGVPNRPLEISFDGVTKTVVVSLATGPTGALISTAGQVIDAVNAIPGFPVYAFPYRTQIPSGIVLAEGPLRLWDYLNAPARISREPYTVKMIRIGKHRNGSRTGVFIYSQVHAREWVTPLVALETAARLLYNYDRDEPTRQLVDNLDIFIVPCANPDGGHYSFYDYRMQRRNMTNYGGPTVSDPARRNSWGVDLNRNFSVGTLWEGYAGASTSPTSDTYAGPHPLSEPEVRNLVWVVERFRNIKFAMDVHSHGGYFMWAPGAYKSVGRVTLPRPTLGEELYFWRAAERILDGISRWRTTVVHPGRTGPICDVLYSAAGCSSDEMWYKHGLFAYAFEISAQRWTGTSWVDVGFQPAWPEAFDGAMEFAHGCMELLRVGLSYHRDQAPPRSFLEIIPEEGTTAALGALGLEFPLLLDFESADERTLVFNGPVRIRFGASEPADVYYTLDGSRPTFNSSRYLAGGLRELGEEILLETTTQINFFSRDIKGHVEKRYNPAGRAMNFNRVKIVIESPVGALVP